MTASRASRTRATSTSASDDNASDSMKRVRGLMRDDLHATSKGKGVADKAIRPRCEDCNHFKGVAHPAMGKPCQQLGIAGGAPAPSCYSPNVSVLRPLGPSSIAQVATLVAAFTPNQLRVFDGLLRSKAKLTRRGLAFMQEVVFCLGRGECLSAYYTGWVLSVGPDDMVQVVGRNFMRSGDAACTAVLSKSALLTKKQFRILKDRLIAEGKLSEVPRPLRSTIAADDYEPPTMDMSAELLEARASQKGRFRKDRSKADKNFAARQGFVIDEEALRGRLDADDGEEGEDVDGGDGL